MQSIFSSIVLMLHKRFVISSKPFHFSFNIKLFYDKLLSRKENSGESGNILERLKRKVAFNLFTFRHPENSAGFAGFYWNHATYQK